MLLWPGMEVRYRLQLEQSDMHLALNMAKMSKGGFSHSGIKQTQYLVNILHATVQQGMIPAPVFPGHRKVKAAIECQPVLVVQI